MKKTLALALCTLFLACAGLGAWKVSAAEETTVSAVPAAGAEAERSRQYGMEEYEIVDEDAFSAQIYYPVAELETPDKELKDWVDKTLADFKARAQTEPENDAGVKALLEVDYDSYELNSRYVGVKESGYYYTAATVDAPVHVAFTLNFDIQTGKVLAFNDVFN